MINLIAVLFIILSQILFGCFCDTGKFVQVYAAEVQEESVALPILMFHSFTENEEGIEATTVISDKKFKETIEILQANGYKSISFTELKNYLEGRGELPEKPYMITADDGYLDNYELMYPILKEKNEKAVISVIGESIGVKTATVVGNKWCTPKIGWKEISEMLDSGLVEIGNHTYKMHDLKSYYGQRDGGIINDDEYQSVYAKEFSEDVLKLNKLLQEHCDVTPQVFCYPYGYFDILSEALISGCGFSASLTTDEGMNFIDSEDDLKIMKRYNVSMDTDIEKLIEQWEREKVN